MRLKSQAKITGYVSLEQMAHKTCGKWSYSQGISSYGYWESFMGW